LYAVVGCGKCGSSLLGALLSTQTKTMRYIYQPIAVSSTTDDLIRSGTKPDNWLGITESGELVFGREKAFGSRIVGGLGKDFALGNSTFQRVKPYIGEALEEMLPSFGGRVEKEEINFVLLLFGLGGGTGGGGSPVIAEAFKNKGIRVIGVGVLPANSEGDGFAWNAFRSLRESLIHMDGLLLADNNLIDKPGGLDTLYPQFNRYIVGCVSDFILGALGGGMDVKHGGMASFDYVDFSSSLTIYGGKGVGILGRDTISPGFLGSIKSFNPKERVNTALSQLSVDVEVGDNIKKLACMITMHKSLRRGFPFHEIEEDLRDRTDMKQAYIGFNETKNRMLRVTLSLTYDPDDVSRLWDLRDRAERYVKSLADEGKKRAGERLFKEGPEGRLFGGKTS